MEVLFIAVLLLLYFLKEYITVLVRCQPYFVVSST